MSRRKAFTLVELLVVIGVIAVLIGILLPTLSGAQGRARDIQCQSNLRQVGQALFMYANDNQGWLIPVDNDPRRQIVRTKLFEEVAKTMGRESKLVDLNVFFGNDFKTWSFSVNVSYPIGTSQAVRGER